MQRIEITGQRFGILTAMSYEGRNKWACLCDCGNTRAITSTRLRSGHTKSCGCNRGMYCRDNNTTHGMTRTRTYETWNKMRDRCTNPKAVQYKWYGGRGIAVCKRWEKFESFLADMGERPDGKTLDRRDNDGNYEPTNCKWSTQQEQMLNSRRTVLFEGKTMNQWAKETGIPYSTLIQRMRFHGTIWRKS